MSSYSQICWKYLVYNILLVYERVSCIFPYIFNKLKVDYYCFIALRLLPLLSTSITNETWSIFFGCYYCLNKSFDFICNVLYELEDLYYQFFNTFHEFYWLNATRININTGGIFCSNIIPLQSHRNRGARVGGYSLRQIVNIETNSEKARNSTKLRTRWKFSRVCYYYYRYLNA